MGRNQYVIFGAGNIGKLALEKFQNRVCYVIDNNKEITGRNINGKVIKGFNQFLEDSNKKDYTVVIASSYINSMISQLENNGISNYIVFQEKPKMFGKKNDLIINPYENRDSIKSEAIWNYQSSNQKWYFDEIRATAEMMNRKGGLFQDVEIETINRCNGSCMFCPVNRENDTREFKIMDDCLFESIINQLEELNYRGRCALFSNNEPFLDKKIIMRQVYARRHLPHAKLHLFTNGTLLTLDKFIEIIPYLDELIIDNYHSELQLLENSEKIIDYCVRHEELKDKVTIVLRDPNEILSTRGGDAPNRKEKISYGECTCQLPFQQLIIRPDGKVSLCCNDPLGKMTLGDAGEERLEDIWNNKNYREIRENILIGRKMVGHCNYCDFFA